MALINIKNTNDPLHELIDIVNQKNIVTGRAERKTFLKNRHLIRRAAHIWLFDKNENLWLQQRGKHKDQQPLFWSSAACGYSGYIRSGLRTKAQILKEATREMKEEIGLKIKIKLFKIFPLPMLKIGGMMIYWYFGKSEGPFKINRKELTKIKKFDINKLWNLYKLKKIQLTEPFIEELKYYFKFIKK